MTDIHQTPDYHPRSNSKPSNLGQDLHDSDDSFLGRDTLAWLRYPVVSAYKAVKLSSVTSVLSLVIISTTMTLSIIFLTILFNLQGMFSSHQRNLTLSIYLKEGLKNERLSEITDNLKADQAIESVKYRSKEEAMKLFSAELRDYSFALDGLGEENPLPASLEVQFNPSYFHDGLLRLYQDKLENWDGIEFVQYNRSFLDKILDLSVYLKSIIWCSLPILMIIVGISVWFVVRLASYVHRQEIEVKRLVGASEWYVWSPFVVEGMVLGVLGSLIGYLVNQVGITAVNDLLNHDLLLGSFVSNIDALPLTLISLLIIVSGFVGGLSGYLASRN